ncbi:MAG: lactonase family protein [Solirubrobacteraceae bacterium]
MFGQRTFAHWLAPLAATGALLALPATAAAHHHGRHQEGPGRAAFYTADNNPAGNNVLVFSRSHDGLLSQTATVSTGGIGISSTPPFGFPIVDSSGSINLTHGGKLLFVVNAGDNTISSFRVTEHGLQLADRASSGGELPISLTSHGHVLYVLNGLSNNISGLRFTGNGHLDPIAGSTQSLTASSVDAPAQIGFSPDGRTLVVTIRTVGANGSIDTFRVEGHGVAGPAQAVASDAPLPFGFAFTRRGVLEVTNAGLVNSLIPDIFDPTKFVGSTSSWSVSNSGALTLLGNTPSGGRALCWIAITKNDRYAFASNTLSDTPADLFTGTNAISEYKIAPDGTLTLLGNASSGPGTPGDVALSRDSKYLYVTNPAAPVGPNTSHIDVFKVGGDGSLTLIQSTPAGLPGSISGAAAH